MVSSYGYDTGQCYCLDTEAGFGEPSGQALRLNVVEGKQVASREYGSSGGGEPDLMRQQQRCLRNAYVSIGRWVVDLSYSYHTTCAVNHGAPERWNPCHSHADGSSWHAKPAIVHSTQQTEAICNRAVDDISGKRTWIRARLLVVARQQAIHL